MFNHRLLSAPVRIHWAGWETDTYLLQQAGWSINAHQDVVRDQMRIAIEHRGVQMRGLSAGINWEYQEALRNPRFVRNGTPLIPMNVMGRDVRVHERGNIDWSNFQPIDAQPQLIESRINSLSDLVHFAPSLARTQQIILPEDDVPAMLERILEMQNPARIERLKQQLDADREGMMIDHHPRQKFHAQILSIAA